MNWFICDSRGSRLLVIILEKTHSFLKKCACSREDAREARQGKVPR